MFLSIAKLSSADDRNTEKSRPDWGASAGIRTRMPGGLPNSGGLTARCVYQFHHTRPLSGR
jgi:hypothetical protein